MPTWGDPTRTMPAENSQGFEYDAAGIAELKDRVSKLEQQLVILNNAKAINNLQTTSFMLGDRVNIRSDITTPTDANFVRPIDGLAVYITSTNRLWIRSLGVWRSVLLA